MVTNKTLKMFAGLLSILVSLCCFSSSAFGENELKKQGGQKWLGWIDPEDKSKFRTCGGSEVKVENGTVTETTRKCSRQERYLENIRRIKGNIQQLLPMSDTDNYGLGEFDLIEKRVAYFEPYAAKITPFVRMSVIDGKSFY